MSAVTSTPAISPELKHFLALARRGRPHTGASSGELRCRRIAQALLDNCGGLDGQALAGAAEFVLVAAAKPEAARDAINLWD